MAEKKLGSARGGMTFLRYLFQYAYRDCHTAAQMSYYNGLLKTCVIGSLANECEKSPDFAKAMLKEAAIRAKKKDEEHIAWQLAHGIKEIETHDFRNALTRAKNRMRYRILWVILRERAA